MYTVRRHTATNTYYNVFTVQIYGKEEKKKKVNERNGVVENE